MVEYVSHVDDGSMLLVTSPRDDWSYESFRLPESVSLTRLMFLCL